MQTKLSNSFSVNDFRNISSYRELRMLTRPLSSSSQFHDGCTSVKQDLESIQQSLRKTLTKKRQSMDVSQSAHSQSQPLDGIMGKLIREVEQLPPQRMSEGAMEESNRYKQPNKYVLFESSLNTIVENPMPYNATSRRDIKNSENVCYNKTGQITSAKVLHTKSKQQNLNPQSSTVRLAKKQTIIKPQKPQSKVNKQQCSRVMKKLDQLRDQISRLNLRKHPEIQSHLNSVLEMMREEL